MSGHHPACDMRFAVVGCGSIGKRHARNLVGLGVRDVGVQDVDVGRARALADESPVTPLAGGESLWGWGPDVVLVATPNAHHMSYALEAARRGCHLFVEKPLSHNLDGVDELRVLLAASGKTFLMGSNFKFHPSFCLMKRMLVEECIGRVFSFNIVAGQYLPDWHPYEDYRDGYSANRSLGGGVLLDAHEFDYVQWLLGPITRLSCVAGKYSDLEIDTEDVAELIIETEGRAVGGVHVDYIQHPYRRTYAFYGAEGSIEWSSRERSVITYSKDSKEYEEYPEDPEYDPNDMYVEQARHLMDVVSGRAESVTDIESAVRTLRVVEAAKRSSGSHEAVVL